MSETVTVKEVVAGQPVELVTFGDWISEIDARAILAGETYFVPPDLKDVELVLDVGANVGATSVLFACHFPGAKVHSFEPAPATYEALERNVRAFPNVTAHNFGLGEVTEEVDLYRGSVGPGQASIHRRASVTDWSDRVLIREAGAWISEAGIDSIDILKIDTEGCELPIFRSLGPVLATTRLLFAEFHSAADRREIEALLAPTHTLALAKQFFETGEVLYLRNDQVEALRGSITAATLMPAAERYGSSSS